MDTSDIIAFIALLISIVVAISEFLSNKKNNVSNLNAYYFNEIYREHLIKYIPSARNYIRFDRNGKVVGHEHMIEEMKKIQRDSLYYKYTDSNYFGKLKQSAQAVENYLIGCDGQVYIGEEQADFYKELTELLEALYRIINKKYLG